MTHAFQPIGNGYLHLRSVREKEKGGYWAYRVLWNTRVVAWHWAMTRD